MAKERFHGANPIGGSHAHYTSDIMDTLAQGQVSLIYIRHIYIEGLLGMKYTKGNKE